MQYNSAQLTMLLIWLISDLVNAVQVFRQLEGKTSEEKQTMIIKLVIRLLIKYAIRKTIQDMKKSKRSKTKQYDQNYLYSKDNLYGDIKDKSKYNQQVDSEDSDMMTDVGADLLTLIA